MVGRRPIKRIADLQAIHPQVVWAAMVKLTLLAKLRDPDDKWLLLDPYDIARLIDPDQEDLTRYLCRRAFGWLEGQMLIFSEINAGRFQQLGMNRGYAIHPNVADIKRQYPDLSIDAFFQLCLEHEPWQPRQ